MWRSIQSSVIVLDTNVLLNFGMVDAYELLERTCSSVIVTRDVFNEVKSEPPKSKLCSFIRQRRFGFYTFRDLKEIELRESFRTRIDPGEASVLAYIYNRSNAVAITDERAVRKICDCSLDSRKTGTIGILAACVQQGHISKEGSEAIHLRMINEASAWSPHSELIELLNQI